MEQSSSTFDQAATLLMERFPKLGLMLGLWTCAPIPTERPILPDLNNVEALYFYGLSSPSIFAQLRTWLDQSEKRHLILLEDDPGILTSFLHLPEALELLSHPQVYLELFHRKEQELAQLAERFPLSRIEFSGLSTKKSLSRLRQTLFRKTALSHALYLDRLHGYQTFSNFCQNLSHIPHSFYANGLKNAFPGVPAIICGAGPSLQRTIPLLRTLEKKALVIAGGSTLAALSSQGILPHFGMAVDPNLEEYRRFKNSFAFEVPLLYSTRVHPSLFQTCNGPFGYMRSGIGGVPELWLEEELGLLDPLLGQFLSPESISVTAICVAWAQFLGCNPILLNGIDMAYTGNRRYAAGVTEDEEVAFQAIDREKSVADRILKRKDRTGKPVYTAVRWIMESASLSHFAKKHPETRFLNTTDGGIGFRGIEYRPLEEAISAFPERELRSEVWRHIKEHPMPAQTLEKIGQLKRELQESLQRVIHSLRILSGELKGSSALAEMDLKEEMASLFLFHDVYQILKPGPDFWKSWLDLALNYGRVFLSS